MRLGLIAVDVNLTGGSGRRNEMVAHSKGGSFPMFVASGSDFSFHGS